MRLFSEGPSNKRCRASRRHEGALEKCAPLGIEIIEQFLAMQFELWTIAIVTYAHRSVLVLCELLQL